MSPGNWVAIILGLVAVCWAAGVYLEIANYQLEEMRALADMEAMLKADPHDSNYRPQMRAGTESLLQREKKL